MICAVVWRPAGNDTVAATCDGITGWQFHAEQLGLLAYRQAEDSLRAFILGQRIDVVHYGPVEVSGSAT